MLFLVASVAWADETTMTYDLYSGDADVGDRTVSVRYLTRDDGERRILSVVTTATTPLGEVACRSSGQSSQRGANFTTSLSVAGAVSEVQGIETPSGGWQLVTADKAGVHEASLKPGQVQFTTMDVLDPGRTGLLAVPGHVTVLLAETGELMEGELAEGEPATTKIGGKPVEGTRYVVSGEGGRAVFVVDANGVLLSSELSFLGGKFRTVARKLPPPRTWGTLDVVDSPGGGTQESEL